MTIMKSTYWSCSKFADWLRGTPKLSSGTAEEWKAWKTEAKTKPFRYWLAEDGLDHMQDTLCWPINCMKILRTYLNNRWFTKSHALTSRLKRGEWHDFDARLLHAAFDELINFVEIEQAWMEVVCLSKEERKKYRIPWYRRLFRIGAWQCPEAGITYLQWASKLKLDEDGRDKDSPEFGQPTSQAQAAQEILFLYTWWKHDRPDRFDPYEASGWSDHSKEKLKTAKESDDDDFFDNLMEDKSEAYKDSVTLCHKLEKEQEEEDTTMLIRLVKIRHHLWT